jgi:hypothetical protein
MSISRRKFVRVGLIATVVAAAPLKGVFGQSWKLNDGNPGNTPPDQTDPLGNYSKASFMSYLNSIFELHTVHGVVAVTLAQIDDLPAAKDGECFSLLFRGGSLALKQDTYTLVHPSLGTFQLLLVPSGSDKNGAQAYVATLNRLSKADFSNISPPSRATNAARRQSSAFGNSTSTGISSSSATTNAPTATPNAPTVAPANVVPAITTTAPVSSPGAHRRKQRRKPVDPKTPMIN